MKAAKDEPIRLSKPKDDLQNTLKNLPVGRYEAQRYDTDNEHVLTVWQDGKTYDLRMKKVKYREWKML